MARPSLSDLIGFYVETGCCLICGERVEGIVTHIRAAHPEVYRDVIGGGV